MNVGQARDLMAAIESFGVLQFIEVAVVLMAVLIVWGVLRSQRPMQDATVRALRDNGDTNRALVDVIQRNTVAMQATERATERQSENFVKALDKVVEELVTSRRTDTDARLQMQEALEKSMGTYGNDVSARFDEIKAQLATISAKLETVQAVPELMPTLQNLVERLTALERLVTASTVAPPPPTIAPPETT